MFLLQVHLGCLYFSVTQCNLFFSGPRELDWEQYEGNKGDAEHSMGLGRCSCHGARTDARLSVSGECQAAEK